jgi:RNA polymerase sigma-70 factor, ECF subfamily
MFAFLTSRPAAKLDDFQQLLARRGDRWYAACLRVTGDSGLAEDAVQEALLKAWSQRAQFRGEADIDTWIHRIALNSAIDQLRRHKPAFAEAAEETRESAEPTPTDVHSRDQLGRDLGHALQRLTDMERMCFVLKHLEGWRLDEIAREMDNSLNGIKQALFRAVRKLRSDLEHWRGDS